MRPKDLPLLELSFVLSLAAGIGAAFMALLAVESDPFLASAILFTAAGAFLAATFVGFTVRCLRGVTDESSGGGTEAGGVAGRVAATLLHLRARERELPARVRAMLEAAVRGEPVPAGLAAGEEAVWGAIRTFLDERAAAAGTGEDCGERFAALRNICGELERGAELLVELRDRLGEATRESSQDMQSIAAAVEQLSVAVGEIGRNTNVSAEVARRCVGETRQSREEADRLGDAAGRIASIVETIRQIADQTTLLALNATIEAARAGAAGRSFAVVAGEVKALAQQTAAATEDIDRRIDEVKAAVDKVGASIEVIMATAGEADQAASAIATAVEQQGAVIDEIAQRLQRASDATNRIDRAVTRHEGDAGGDAHLETVAHTVRENAGRLMRAIEAEASSRAQQRAA